MKVNFAEPVVMSLTVLQWVVLATFTGAVVGAGAGAFLLCLNAAIASTDSISLSMRMLALPVGGLLTGIIMYYGYRLNKTGLDDSIIKAVHSQAGRMPFRTLAIKPLAAIVTLASGGSAGREGPCSHIGATFASGIGHVCKLNAEMQKRIVACGISAGFASVFGTPVAGAIYGVEVLAIGRIRHDFLFPAILASVTAVEVCKQLQVPYTYYRIGFGSDISLALLAKVILIGILCGLVAWMFVEAVNLARQFFSWVRIRFGVWPPLLPMLGGLMLSALIVIIPTEHLSLSLPVMNSALHGETVPYMSFLWKILLVAITLGSGFYGGIATPQLVIGAISGNALAQILSIDPAFGAAVGLVAVLAAASNTPVAAIVMGVELFSGGYGIVYLATASITAYLIVGHRSVYPDQLLAYPKSSWMRARSDLPLGQERIRLSHGLLRGMTRLPLRHRRHARRHPPR